jgi:hypothetical protein
MMVNVNIAAERACVSRRSIYYWCTRGLVRFSREKTPGRMSHTMVDLDQVFARRGTRRHPTFDRYRYGRRIGVHDRRQSTLVRSSVWTRPLPERRSGQERRRSYGRRRYDADKGT